MAHAANDAIDYRSLSWMALLLNLRDLLARAISVRLKTVLAGQIT